MYTVIFMSSNNKEIRSKKFATKEEAEKAIEETIAWNKKMHPNLVTPNYFIREVAGKKEKK